MTRTGEGVVPGVQTDWVGRQGMRVVGGFDIRFWLSKANVLYLVMGHPLVMGQFRPACKIIKYHHHQLNISSQHSILHIIEAIYLLFVPVKYKSKIYKSKPLTLQNHHISLRYKCWLLEFRIEKIPRINTQMLGYRSQVNVEKGSG